MNAHTVGLVGRCLLAAGSLVSAAKADTPGPGQLLIYNLARDTTNIENGGSSIERHDIWDVAREGKDNFDIEWDAMPPMTQPTRMKACLILYDGIRYELQCDTRPANSMSPVELELGIQGEPATCSNYLRFRIKIADNFEYKNIIAEQYGLDNVLDASYNVKDVAGQDIFLGNLVNQTGTYDKWVIWFSNAKTDRNADLRVDGKDLALLCESYAQGEAGIEDLQEMAEQWLWERGQW